MDPGPDSEPEPDVTYVFEVSNSIAVDYLGHGLDTFRVISRKTVTGLPDMYPTFSFEFFSYDSLASAFTDVAETSVTGEWLTALNSSAVPGEPAETLVKTTIAPSTPEISTFKMALIDEELSCAPMLGSADDPFDLSTYHAATGQTGARNTANCYVVTAPGWYMFPLVYGNALQGATPQVVSSPFIVDAHGVSIDNTNYKCPADSVQLLWQDQPNRLVRHIGLITSDKPGNSGLQFVRFYVDPQSIRQGNALIAASQGGTVCWSWHIWVADPDMLKTVRCTYSGWDNGPVYAADEPHDFMGVNLGWFTNTDADVTLKQYPLIVGKLRITQSESGLTRDVLLTQTSYQDKRLVKSADGYCTYYQWGRKDPLAPKKCADSNQSYGGAGYYRTLYDVNGQVISEQYPLGIYDYETGKNQFERWAQHPVVSYAGYPLDEQTTGYDMWQCTKTVYDPCPSGFRVPAVAEFAPIADYIRHTNDTYRYGLVYTDATESAGGNQILLPCMTDYMPGGVSSGTGFGYWLADLREDKPVRYLNMAGGGYTYFHGASSPFATSYCFFPGNGQLGSVIRPVCE